MVDVAVFLGFNREFHSALTDFGHYFIKVEFLKPDQASKISSI